MVLLCRSEEIRSNGACIRVALTETHIFGGLFSGFGNPEAPHEQFGVSWSQVAPLEGKGATWVHLWDNFE